MAATLGLWQLNHWLGSSGGDGPPLPHHDLECVGELRRIVDLSDKVQWWSWLARLLAFLMALAALTILALVVLLLGGLTSTWRCLRRSSRSKVSEAHVRAEVDLVRQRAAQRGRILTLGDGAFPVGGL